MSFAHAFRQRQFWPSILLFSTFFYLLATCHAHYATDVEWSTPEECARQCVDGEPPRYCYYKFIVEYYATMGPACDICKPNITNQLTSQALCECIEADGIEKTVLSINRMIPGPTIQVCLHDRVVIDVENKADGLEVSIHWHGLFQKGYQYYDGVPYVTQCPIQSGATFRYAFGADNDGTHMYHSHISVHMIDGQYGGFIIRAPPSKDPHYKLYDEDLITHVMVVSDWLHQLSIERYPGLYRHMLGQAAQNILINGKGRILNDPNAQVNKTSLAVFTVEPGKRYRFRLASAMGTVCGAKLTIANHSLLVIAQDGENIEPITVDTLMFSSGERIDFVLTADQEVKSYWIIVNGVGECTSDGVYQVAILQYAGAPEEPSSPVPLYSGIPSFTVYNSNEALECDDDPTATETEGNICTNHLKSLKDPDPELMKVKPDYRLILPFWFYPYQLSQAFAPNSYSRFMVAVDQSVLASMINNISYVEPDTPMISQSLDYDKLCDPQHMPKNYTEPFQCSYVYHLKKGAVVELVVYDAMFQPFLSHPFHLHGFAYSIFAVGEFAVGGDTGNVSFADMEKVIARHEDRLAKGLYDRPSEKDTLRVPHSGYTIVRFIANNPGWWLYHCHFLWHTVTGMDVVLHVGEEDDLPPTPEDFPQCNSWLPVPVFYDTSDYSDNYVN